MVILTNLDPAGISKDKLKEVVNYVKEAINVFSDRIEWFKIKLEELILQSGFLEEEYKNLCQANPAGQYNEEFMKAIKILDIKEDLILEGLDILRENMKVLKI